MTVLHQYGITGNVHIKADTHILKGGTHARDILGIKPRIENLLLGAAQEIAADTNENKHSEPGKPKS